MLNRSDVIYRYDGSFEGFLCCIFHSFRNKEIPLDIVSEQDGQISFYPEVWIGTEQKLADRVFSSIPVKISQQAAQMVSEAFLS